MCVSAVGTTKCVRGSALSAVSRSAVGRGDVISGGDRWRRSGLRACGGFRDRDHDRRGGYGRRGIRRGEGAWRPYDRRHGLSTIVEEHGEGEVEGRGVLIVERGRVAQPHLDGASGRYLGRFRTALAAELVEKRLLRPGGATERGARPRRKRAQGSRGRVGSWQGRSLTY